MLWIGIHLPRLALDTALRGLSSPEMWAIVENGHILFPDGKARARGIREGMTVNTALGFAARLRTLPRDRSAETETLLGLAAWAGRFTPSVAVEFPDTLLLEVEPSLKIFHGLEAILHEIRKGMDQLGFHAQLGCAPTPRAAAWFARDAKQTCVTAEPELRASIAQLPVSLLQGRAGFHETLASLGIRSMKQVMALPRDGLARRLGQEVLDQLDQALGQLADPRLFFTPPPTFQVSLELPAEVSQAEMLFFAGHRLLAQMAGFLAARCAGVQRFTFRLRHREGRTTTVELGLMTPSRELDHLTPLLRERLHVLALREPVRALTLEAKDVRPLTASTHNLFLDDKVSNAQTEWPRLIERLRARLGTQSVHALQVVAEHRPELASRAIAPGSAGGGKQLPLEFGERPFWLLESPRPLPESNAVPLYENDPLTLLAGPERIESGWWDNNDIRRDYFIARTTRDALVWIFREHHAGWYLHGLFS